MKRFYEALLPIVMLPVLFLLALAGWRVDVFEISDSRQNIIFSAPAALGHKFITRYIHSVELTPVEDEYMVIAGRLWTWEERTRSTNAGLPFGKPKYGKFIATGDWMIYQGGRMSWTTYYYRVGNKKLGLNQAAFEPFGRKNFFDLFPGERLIISVRRTPYIFTAIYRSAALIGAANDVPAIGKRDRD
jgi:hypothetical protein